MLFLLPKIITARGNTLFTHFLSKERGLCSPPVKKPKVQMVYSKPHCFKFCIPIQLSFLPTTRVSVPLSLYRVCLLVPLSWQSQVNWWKRFCKHPCREILPHFYDTLCPFGRKTLVGTVPTSSWPRMFIHRNFPILLAPTGVPIRIIQRQNIFEVSFGPQQRVLYDSNSPPPWRL